MPEILTPIKSIRAFCIECSGGSTREPAKCPSKRCDLYHYRLGKRPKNPSADVQTPVKSIRSKCVDCRGGSIRAPAKCKDTDCKLYPYRLGRRPKKSA